MNHNVAIANMNPMAGPIGGAAPIPMMNNGNIQMVPQPPGPVGAPQPGAPPRNADRSQLNKYIYDYFLRNGMYDCARALLTSDKSVTNVKVEGGKIHGNGVTDDAMDTDTKDEIDQKLPEDLPPPDVPNTSSDTSFLYDWFCLFWEMWKAQGKSGSTSVYQYVNHTQAQSRMKQNHQQEMLRQMRGDMGVQHLQAMRNMQQNGALAMNMKQGGNLARTAMANNQNNPQVMQMMQAKQGPRDPSELENMRQRASSPGSESAASPSKRPRLDGPPFNPGQPGMMPNGRPVQGMPGQPGAMHSNPNPAQILMAAGVQTAGLTQAQLQNFANVSQGGQAKSIASYSQNLQQHHGSQMPNKQMPNTGGPQNQGSPTMIPQAPEGINAYYNAPGGVEAPGRMGPGPGGAQGGNSSHALQDYQMQLMLLEQQNKKRLLMARQEQDNLGTGPRDGSGGPPGQVGGPNGPGANGQFSDSSPQAIRAGASPNPTDQTKRGTPQMGNAGMPSPLPEGSQSRGSPNPMSFGMGGQMDPNGPPPFSHMMPMNGMRPPSSHPNQPFNGQMNAQQQQMMVARQQQLQQQQQQQGHQTQQGPQPQHQGNPPGQWPQGAPNGAQMVSQGSQNPIQGTPQPQPRPMPPPSAPVTGNNNRVSPAPAPTPPTPKPKQIVKATKPPKESKRLNTQKKAAIATGTTPAAETTADAEPTPATPITPVTQGPFAKTGTANANGTAVANGQSAGGVGVSAPAPSTSVAPPHPDPTQGPSFGMENAGGMVDFPMEFGNTLSNGNMMEDFDFDSFLHDNDTEPSTFDFNNAFTGLEGTGEIGATE